MGAYINLQNVDVSIPVFSTESFSLRTRILRRSTKIKENHVLRNINFEITGGERVGIYGHNGAGKTSLLRLISGALPIPIGITDGFDFADHPQVKYLSDILISCSSANVNLLTP